MLNAWRRTMLLAAAVVLALCASLSGAHGQDRPESRLSLADALRLALEQNLDLVAARKDPQIAEQSVQLQRAPFDPVLGAGVTKSKSEQEVFNISDITSREFDGADVSVTQVLPFGGDYAVQLRGGRQTVSGALISLDSSYSAELAAQFRMPLLNGRGTEVTTETLELARNNLGISRDQLRVEAHRVVETVEAAYWDLVAAREALRIARLSLTRAEDLLSLNRKKVEVGTLAPIEITQAEAGVASQEEGVIVAEATVDNAEDELRRLLAIPPQDALWNQRIMPADEPVFVMMQPNLDEALSVATAERAELRSARQSVRNRELSERVAKRRIQPNLDFEAQVAPSGNNFTTGPGFDGIPGTIDDEPVPAGRLAEALKEIPDFVSYDWSVGLRFTLPIGNRQAKAAYATSTLERERADIALLNQEQAIRVEVRQAVRAVESGGKRVSAAQSNVGLQQKKLEAEQKKFDNGMSTSFEVLTFQNDLANAELAEIRAVIDYRKALVAYERAKGTLLESRGMSLGPS